MFLERPSTRKSIEGFMTKPNRDFGEFQSLTGFNLTELSYELIQATTLLYYESENVKAPCKIGQMTIHNHNIILKIIDNNNAILHIDFFDHSSVDIDYNYRTDNFPGFNIYYFSGSFVARDNVMKITNTSAIPKDFILEVLSDISVYIPHLLWRVYKKKMSDKK